MLVGRPVKYVEDRVTHIVNNDHCGSDRHYDAALAFDDDGILKALRIECVDDYGAYLQFGTGTHGNGALADRRPLRRIQHVEYSLCAVLTNKNQQGAYRGFGAEVSNWMLERLVDLAARDLGMDRVEIRRRNLLDARPVPVRHADRQHLRQRQLPGRAGEDPRGGRLRPLGRLPRAGAPRGPARRHRRRRLAGAQRLQLDRVLVLVRQAGVHADLEPGEREPADRPDRADRGHAALAVAVGQQPGDRRLAGRGRGVRRRPERRRRDLRRLAARAAGHRAGRLALHGDGLGRGGRRGRGAEGEDPAHRLRPARGGGGRPGVPRRRRRRSRARRTSTSTLAEIALTAYMFRLDLPPDMESGLARSTRTTTR